MLTDRELRAAARVLQALAHPVRLGVLQALRDGEMTVGDLHLRLGCSQSMMSQQLRILAAAGLVGSRKEATSKFCFIRNRDFLKVFACMEKHLVLIGNKELPS
jgi:ArsR family transcriptional regulator